MRYLRCNNCGHLNAVSSERLLFCERCNKKINNNYSDWKQRFPEKSFDNFINEVCVDIQDDVAKYSPAKPKGKFRFATALLIFLLTIATGFVVLRFVTGNAEKIVGFSPDEIEFLANDTARWQPFMCEEGNFIAFFPGKPEQTKSVNSTEVGDIEIVTCFVESYGEADQNYVFGVGYSVYPVELLSKEAEKNRNIDLIFDGAVMGSINSAGAKLLSSYFEPFGEFQGRAVLAELNGGDQMLSMRFYLVDNVMYCIQVITPAQHYPNRAIDFFFNTFSLLR